jgi:quinoprotein glucose dehydrogenase
MVYSPSHALGRSRRHLSVLLLLLAVGVQACAEAPQDPPQPEIVAIEDAEAALAAERAAEEVSVVLADGLEIDLWASETLVKDPVALHMDHLGRAWITMTNRSNSSEFDIRQWPQWTTVAHSFRTVEDRRAFLRSYFSPERSEENADRMPDRNEDGLHDWRDLTVDKEEVYLIQDLTGDGRANQSQLFIRDFHEDITDVAASVLHHAGDVYVGVAPDVWRLRDTTGDGMADSKESISHGYGVHIGIWGHGVSGLTLGPDGRLYWSIGDPGFNIVDQEGNHWDYPHQGAIFRSEPDGSNFEVFARGLRNTHEFAFDKYGNLITVDNDGDFPGEFERLLYLINGADGGWRIHWQHGKYTDERNNAYNVWSHESYYHPRFDDQAAHVLPAMDQAAADAVGDLTRHFYGPRTMGGNYYPRDLSITMSHPADGTAKLHILTGQQTLEGQNALAHLAYGRRWYPNRLNRAKPSANPEFRSAWSQLGYSFHRRSDDRQMSGDRVEHRRGYPDTGGSLRYRSHTHEHVPLQHL